MEEGARKHTSDSTLQHMLLLFLLLLLLLLLFFFFSRFVALPGDSFSMRAGMPFRFVQAKPGKHCLCFVASGTRPVCVGVFVLVFLVVLVVLVVLVLRVLTAACTCVAVQCLEGFYETQALTATSNRVCSECQEVCGLC